MQVWLPSMLATNIDGNYREPTADGRSVDEKTRTITALIIVGDRT